MLEPITGYLARKRLARIQSRVNWLTDRIAEGGPVSHFQSERTALQWAIDEVTALYADHERKTASKGKR